MRNASNHQTDRCCLCNKKIDKNKNADGYCQGHTQYEIIKRIQQLQVTQLTII